MTEHSANNQIQKRNNVDISCWNCFNVENEDKDSEIEVPLSKIRQKNREKFKLYSILASEVTRPKAIPIKQKVRENYAIGKKIEKKLVDESKKTKDVCIQVNEETLRRRIVHVPKDFEDDANIIIIKPHNVSYESPYTAKAERSTLDLDTSKSASTSSVSFESARNTTATKLDSSIKSYDGSYESPYTTKAERSKEELDSSKFGSTSNVSFESARSPDSPKFNSLGKRSNISYESPYAARVERNKPDSVSLKSETCSFNASLESANSTTTPKMDSFIKQYNVSYESPYTTKTERSKQELDSSNAESTSNVSFDSPKCSATPKFDSLLKQRKVSYESPYTSKTERSKQELDSSNSESTSNISLDSVRSSATPKFDSLLKQRKVSYESPYTSKAERSTIELDSSKSGSTSSVSFDSARSSVTPKFDSLLKQRKVSYESPYNTKVIQSKQDSDASKSDSSFNLSLDSAKSTGTPKLSSLPKQYNVSYESPYATKVERSKKDSDTSKPGSIFVASPVSVRITTVKKCDSATTPHKVSYESPYTTKTERSKPDLDSLKSESTLTDKRDTSSECSNTTLSEENQEEQKIAPKRKSSIKSQNFSTKEDGTEKSEIKYKVQIETSTPKTYIDVKDVKVNEKSSPDSTPDAQKHKEYDIRSILQRIPNTSITERDESVTESEKTDNTGSVTSESGYEGSSIRDLHDIDSLNKNLAYAKHSASTKSLGSSLATSLTSSSILTNSKSREDFKTSLPSLNITQKRRNILKSTKSLYADIGDTEIKPVKCLRWSTLDLPHGSSNTDDEVYMSDSVSPNHATLPRRSNSPHHDRDMLDRDRYSLNRSGLQVRSESMASVYSGAGEGTRANVTIRGEVQISLLYNYRLGALEVGVKRCRDLAPVDVKRNRSDPYVKVYLLPDKSKAGKRKTKVKKNTLNPVFEETLSFVQPLASLSARTLWLSVWHADMFGRNDFLGEVTLPLADVVFDDPAPMWYKLHERTEQFDEQQGSRGDLIIGLKLELTEGARGKGTLHVLVKEAKNLVATKPNGLADVFCKSYLLPERGRLAKQKTAVCRRTLSPVWEHTFTYRGLAPHELAQRALELSLWDRDRLASNDFMGGVRLSLGSGTYMGANVNWMDSTGKEVTLWQTMMQRPNFWVEGSLQLRPNLSN
uniref:SFRICE_012460 n=1 Tax=Spodoptera frugiperda TaxID=7108 RepID=A0A2H1VEF1_SPOFR